MVEQVLKAYLKKHKLNIPSEKKLQMIIVKEIREELRKYVGRYQIKSKKREEYLNQKNLLSRNSRMEWPSFLLKTMSFL